jgi:putative transposase
LRRSDLRIIILDMRFAPNEFYHIVNRGNDGKIIFPQKSDYLRFLEGLKLFNSPIPIELRRAEIGSPQSQDKKLVHLISYCLMKDHIHLLLKVINPEDTSKFIKKVFIGYTMYFNTKYQRHGVLFQGKSKSKHIKDWIYLNQVLRYIHLNPLDYIDIRWREHGVKNAKKIKNPLLEYPWSSIKGILREKNDPILSEMLIKEFIPQKEEFIDSLLSWSSQNFDEPIDFI